MSKTLLEMAPTQPSESGCYQNIQHKYQNKSSIIARNAKVVRFGPTSFIS